MGRLVVVSTIVFSLMVSPCFAIEYCKDFLELGNPGGWTASLKTFEDEWTMIVGDEVELDIWINDVPLPLLSGGFWIEYDPSKVSIVSVDAYDGNDIPGPGPWEVAFTSIIPDPGGPGTYMVLVGPPLMPASPDGDGDIIIAKVRFRCESDGEATITISTIPGLDTFVGDTTVFDYDIFPNEIVIHQEIDICEGDFDNDGDQDGSDAALFKTDFGRSPFNRPCPPVSTTTTIPLGCPYGMVDCSTKCVDPMTDEGFCGVDLDCVGGIVCGTTERCVSGVCEIIGDVVYQAAVPKTGQTTCYDSSGTVISCTDTGQDGEYQKGVTWPNPKFTDNSDGTVTDNLTGFIWLKDANCIETNYPSFDNDDIGGDGRVTWQHALDFVSGINDGTYPDCGAGSTDWRLPNRNELASLVVHNEYFNPAVPNTVGTGQWSEGDPFNNVQSSLYWSSTTYSFSTSLAWNVYMSNGLVGSGNRPNDNYVWPVRGGQ